MSYRNDLPQPIPQKVRRRSQPQASLPIQNGSPIPLRVEWFREGRQATREEVLESINTGYPILEEMAIKEGSRALAKPAAGIAALEKMKENALKLIPDAD